MSSPSTVRRFGTAKTYARTRENTASRSYDEMITGKPAAAATVAAPTKASPAYTKWGKTNFVAVRGKKIKIEDERPNEPELPVKEEDPFSFDTDDKGKSSPVKTGRVVLAPEGQRPVTRLPASRIVTQGKAAASFAASSQESGANPTAIARPGRTYTRSSEGQMPPSSSTQLIMDQFVEVGKTVKTNSGSIEVVYTVEPHTPTLASVLPKSPQDVSSAIEKTASPRKSYSRTSSNSVRSNVKNETPKGSSSSAPEDEDDDDIFPATFRRTPLKTYTGEIITPIFDVPDEPFKGKKRKGPTGAPRGRKPSRYTDPSLIEEYRRRYEETHGKREPTAGMFNSTVVSAKELKNNQGTTLVVVCKPKVEVTEKKDDVQTKYFKNVKKELDKADKNLEGVEDVLKEEASAFEGETETKPLSVTSLIPAPCLKKSPAQSQETDSPSSSPSRLLKVHFADEASSAAPKLSASPVKKTALRFSEPARSKVTPVPESNSAFSPDLEFGPCQENTAATNSKCDTSVASRTRSGSTKQYRIFKSRGPKPPLDDLKIKAQVEMPPLKELMEEEVPRSPSMPELTLEVSESADEIESSSNPPNLTDESLETDTSAAQFSETAIDIKDSSPLAVESKQPFSSSESVADRNEASMEESLSPQQGRLLDSQGTPSPLSDDSSQELSQEMTSAESSQKDDNTPAAPRRFFKSKKSSNTSSLQRKVFEKSPSKASYNARSWHSREDSGDKDSEEAAPPAKVARKAADVVVPVTEPSREPRLTRSLHLPKDKDHEAYTSVKVQKQHKELYTVVHNVKMAHEVLESGETQDFMDDIEYLLENLKDDQPVSIRALSTIQLAGRCILPAFRMHLRAHGTVTKIFSLLHDACSNACLALSTAAMMFMLSRDRLNMDLDKETLHLMLKLNEVDMPRSNGEDENGSEEEEAVEDSSELQKCRKRVQEMLVQLQRETKAKQIDLGFVSTGNLAMESLLSLTSRRAGEWFKEELRQLGGLDHFVETVNHCVGSMKGDLASNLDNYTPCLKKLDRCLRVLENITFMNSDNQTYLVAYKKGLLITATGRIMQQCMECLPVIPLVEVDDEAALKEQAGWIVFDCLLAILRVMLNITHDSEFGSTRLGEEEGMLVRVLNCVVSTQWYMPPDQRFDLLVLSLGLLVNLIEHCGVNRRRLMETKLMARLREGDEPQEMAAVKALVELFLERESAAGQMEEAPDTPMKGSGSISTMESPNKSGEWQESDSGIQWIAKSAEKVKEADAQRREAEKEDGDKSIDGASILEDDETFTKALHKAGKHMENSIVASYAGLLIGCLIQDNRKFVDAVKSLLPDESFEPMVKILKKFLGFMSLTTAIGTTDANSLQRVIDNLEAC